jgi:hypothetical protein
MPRSNEVVVIKQTGSYSGAWPIQARRWLEWGFDFAVVFVFISYQAVYRQCTHNLRVRLVECELKKRTLPLLGFTPPRNLRCCEPCQAKILADSDQPSDSTQHRVFPKIREYLLEFAILRIDTWARDFEVQPRNFETLRNLETCSLTILFSNFYREIWGAGGYRNIGRLAAQL